ncbi:MAG: glycosyltransferase family 4 protein [Bacteroidia bacterium]
MKILVVYQYFCTTEGSWSTRIYEFCKRWVLEGHEVTVLTSPYEKSDITLGHHKTEIDGIKVFVHFAHDDNRKSSLWRGLHSLRFATYASRMALTKSYDLILSSSGPLTTSIPLILAKKIRSKKTILEVRDLWPGVPIALGKLKNPLARRLLLKLESLAYKAADQVVTASEDQAQDIKKRFNGINPSVITNASDNDLFDEESKIPLPEWVDQRRLIIHMGSLGFIHNASIWIEVMRYLDPNKYLFVFVGDGELRKEMEQEVEKLNLKHIRFTGLLTKKGVVAWAQKADLSVFATIDHPLQDSCSPNKLFDSFAAGLPVAQTTNGWIKRLIEDHNCGINLDINNAEEMATDIDRFLNSDTYEQACSNSKKLALNKFDRDLLSNQYLDIINRSVQA